MRVRRAALSALACAAGTMLAVNSADAQSNLTMSCETARNVLLATTGEPDNIRLAGATIVRCGDLAPKTLIAAIRNVAVGSLRDSVAQDAAWILSDRRLVDSVIALGKSPQTSGPRRRVAIKLLTHYVDPSARLRPLGAGQPMQLVIGTVNHPELVIGNVPIIPEAQDRALNALRWMATNDPGVETKTLARLAAEQLTLRISLRQ
jgi:hypothetical protein